MTNQTKDIPTAWKVGTCMGGCFYSYTKNICITLLLSGNCKLFRTIELGIKTDLGRWDELVSFTMDLISGTK